MHRPSCELGSKEINETLTCQNFCHDRATMVSSWIWLRCWDQGSAISSLQSTLNFACSETSLIQFLKIIYKVWSDFYNQPCKWIAWRDTSPDISCRSRSKWSLLRGDKNRPAPWCGSMFMSWYVMSCHVILCCYDMLCNICYVMFCYVMSWYVMAAYVMVCYVLLWYGCPMLFPMVFNGSGTVFPGLPLVF